MDKVINTYDNFEAILKDIAFDCAIENPKISVIVPTYNNGKYLPKCLFSLLRQTLKEIEIIAVNDGSNDNTDEILKLFSCYDKRIKVINQPNLKQGAARNNGLKLAVGEYIGYVDSDDWVDFNYYEKLYNAAKKHDADLAFATNIRIGNGRTKKRLNIEKETLAKSLQERIDISNQFKNPCPTNKIYRRKMLVENSISWPEGVYCEDKLYTIKAVYYANAMVAVPDVYYYYFRNPNSTVNNKNVQRRAKAKNDKIEASRQVLNFLKEKKANIRDKDFWALGKEFKILNIPFYSEKESIKTKRGYLFSFIKIFEKRIGVDDV